MGKQGAYKPWAGKWAGQGAWGQASAWDSSSGADSQQTYWNATGAWENPPVAPPRGQEKEQLFPKYSDIKIPGQQQISQGGGQQSQPHVGRDVGQIKEVQRFVNTIRKTEGKIRKSRELCQQRETQWQEFQQQLKNAFMEQRTAYLKDREAQRQEEAALAEQKSQAVRQLKALVNGDERATRTRLEPHQASMEDLQAWQDLITAFSVDEVAEEDNDAWLQAALHAAASDSGPGLRQQVNAWLERQSPAQQLTQGTVTPQRRTNQGLPLTPRDKPMATVRVTPAMAAAGDVPRGGIGHVEPREMLEQSAKEDTYAGGGGQVAQDPYQLSPGAPSAPTFGTPTGRTRFGKAGDRVPVKIATMQGKPGTRASSRGPSPTQQAHANQVESKRIALTKQLGPLLTPSHATVFINDDGDDGGGDPSGGGHSAEQSGGDDLTLLE